MSTNIYILKLQGGRYYVGKSENPMKRYQEHMNGSGSAWTHKYKPLGIEKIIEKASPFDEDKWVKIYMSKHGIEKVRGGAYVLVDLPEFQEEALKSELWGATDKCTTCGRSGHWAKDCYARKDSSGKELQSAEPNKKYKFNTCYNCQEEGHLEYECPYDDEWLCDFCNRVFETRYACTIHEHSCPKKNSKKGSCYRCGRMGHYAPDCYASTHKNGYELD